MDKVSGRTDDMLIVRGVNVFPSQFETVLLQVEGVSAPLSYLVDRERGAMDDLEILVEVSQDVFTDDVRPPAPPAVARRTGDARYAGHPGPRQTRGAQPH
jgi:phenylacetate-coenzyme A ligase PaaK-like adenylate-forming protein